MRFFTMRKEILELREMIQEKDKQIKSLEQIRADNGKKMLSMYYEIEGLKERLKRSNARVNFLKSQLEEGEDSKAEVDLLRSENIRIDEMNRHLYSENVRLSAENERFKRLFQKAKKK